LHIPGSTHRFQTPTATIGLSTPPSVERKVGPCHPTRDSPAVPHREETQPHIWRQVISARPTAGPPPNRAGPLDAEQSLHDVRPKGEGPQNWLGPRRKWVRPSSLAPVDPRSQKLWRFREKGFPKQLHSGCSLSARPMSFRAELNEASKYVIPNECEESAFSDCSIRLSAKSRSLD